MKLKTEFDRLHVIEKTARAYLEAQHAYTVALACHPRERAKVEKAVNRVKTTDAALRAALGGYD